jgi:hypothetical protein
MSHLHSTPLYRKHQRVAAGDILAIQLNFGVFSFAIALGDGSFAFFDVSTATNAVPATLLQQEIFLVAIAHGSAWKTRRWTRVASAAEIPEIKTTHDGIVWEAVDIEAKLTAHFAKQITSARG